MGEKHTRNKIIVNLITSIRVIGAFIIIPLYLLCGKIISGIVIATIFFTDFLDGHLARKLKVQSYFGSILDGFSDKLFGLVILILLTSINYWFLIPIIFEIMILIINVIGAYRGNNIKSSLIGKFKTFLLDISLIISLFSVNIEKIYWYINYIGMPIVSVIQAIVLFDYSIKIYKQEIIIKNKRSKIKLRRKNMKEVVDDLFDTNFYLEHINDGMKGLLYSND